PAGVNEPTEAGVRGTEDILQRVAALGPEDVCLVLLSGGGSALLPAPAAGISLEDKQHVTRLLMHAGASIDELNLVRRNLSRVKGGGLARASNAGKTIGLVISDVIGDPLDVIASGPLLAGSGSRADALAVLERYVEADRIPPAVRSLLSQPAGETQTTDQVNGAGGEVSIHVIGNNAVALQAAAAK
ncbi:MAG: glycerate-2-kinase family protein, partial [Planctomycetaceae bacterium]|nr:glycerate-2-kinase family protein [Planctomycetaceae bacterium]